MGKEGGGHTTAVSGAAAAAIPQLLHCPAAVPPDKTLLLNCHGRSRQDSLPGRLCCCRKLVHQSHCCWLCRAAGRLRTVHQDQCFKRNHPYQATSGAEAARESTHSGGDCWPAPGVASPFCQAATHGVVSWRERGTFWARCSLYGTVFGKPSVDKPERESFSPILRES